MSRHPLVARLLPRLVTQLAPAALVTVVGALVLGNLARTSDAPSTAAIPPPSAITAEAVFTATPREAEAPAEKPAAATRPALAAKPVTPPIPPRKPEPAPRQVASAPAPLPTVPIAEPPQVAATAPEPDRSMLGRLRSATSSVVQTPRWAAQSMASWFRPAEPPRPPATVPQNFQAAM